MTLKSGDLTSPSSSYAIKERGGAQSALNQTKTPKSAAHVHNMQNFRRRQTKTKLSTGLDDENSSIINIAGGTSPATNTTFKRMQTVRKGGKS